MFVVNLRKVGVGCHVKSLFIGCLVYADDIILMAPSVSGLSKMLNCWGRTSESLKLMFNCNKSCCIRFGPSYKRPTDDVILCNHTLSWLESIKYLGTYFNSNKSILTDISMMYKFFSACNCIYPNSRDQTELLQLQLQQSYSLPILTYCTAAVKLSVTNLNHLNACWNSAYRRLFGFHLWESVISCINGLGDWIFIIPDLF